MRFSWDYCLTILPLLLKGLLVTIEASIAGFGLAVLLGLVLAIARRSQVKALSAAVRWSSEFIRDTPLLVQLFFLFYVLPKWGIMLSPLLTGVLGLGIHYSTYTSEVYRAGIDAVRSGQWEATVALNLSRRDTWLRIILPQAVPPMFPALGNYLIGMFKESVVLSAITVGELLRTARILGQDSYRYFEAFTMVGLLFLAISCPAALLVRRLEARYATR